MRLARPHDLATPREVLLDVPQCLDLWLPNMGALETHELARLLVVLGRTKAHNTPLCYICYT